MAVMTHAYNEEDLHLAQGEMGIDRPWKCQECEQKRGLTFGQGAPEEHPWMCGMCWLKEAQQSAVSLPQWFGDATGHSVETLASQPATDQTWRAALQVLANYRGREIDVPTLSFTHPGPVTRPAIANRSQGVKDKKRGHLAEDETEDMDEDVTGTYTREEDAETKEGEGVLQAGQGF